jgi:hypothetical protein
MDAKMAEADAQRQCRGLIKDNFLLPVDAGSNAEEK